MMGCMHDLGSKRENRLTGSKLPEGLAIVMRHNVKKTGSENPKRDQAKLVRALQVLFDLLEDYSPGWYTQEHHHLVCDALASVKAGRPPSSAGRAPKQQKAA